MRRVSNATFSGGWCGVPGEGLMVRDKGASPGSITSEGSLEYRTQGIQTAREEWWSPGPGKREWLGWATGPKVPRSMGEEFRAECGGLGKMRGSFDHLIRDSVS